MYVFCFYYGCVSRNVTLLITVLVNLIDKTLNKTMLSSFECVTIDLEN